MTAGPAGAAASGPGGMGGGMGGGGGAPSGSRPSGGPPSGTMSPPSGGGPGGGGQVSDEAIAWLQAHQGSAKYLVAASGSQTTAPIIIATGEAVVTIGGFTGSDAAPKVSQLAQMVADGELKYVLLSGGGGGGPGGGSSQDAAGVGPGPRHRGDERDRRQRDAVRGLGLASSVGTRPRVRMA